MKISRLIILFFALACISASLHDYHVGITDIRYSPDTRTYQVSLKLITEDLESALLDSGHGDLQLGTKNEVANADALIFEYLSKTFFISTLNNTPLELNEIGRETELDVTWVYYESQETVPKKGLVVKNSALMENNIEQTHVINLTQDGVTKSTLLNTSKMEDTIRL